RAAARRAHRGNPRQGARLQRRGDRRDQDFWGDHRAGERRARGGRIINGSSILDARIVLDGSPAQALALTRRTERTSVRIVVHGQQAFGKAVLEALLKRGEDVVAVYVAPEKPGAKADPLKEAALAAKLPVHQPASYRKPEVWEEFRALKPDLQV